METKNLTISLPKRVWEIIDIDFVGLGDTQAERIQHIVMFLLGSKNYYILLMLSSYCFDIFLRY